MYYGADYYPEHWPKERWETDADLMQKANINIVRVAEFAWAKLEPTEGTYDFEWLDEAIATLSRHGIKVVMGTPTATPPKWLVNKHPEILMQDEHGERRGFGTRRHYCYNSSVYQEYTKKIVTKMAEYYKDNSNVAAWQIDNEFGCHDTTRCYCEECHREFVEWLRKKYKDIDALNRTWGTIFWSQTYDSFEDVILPTHTVAGDKSHNPGLLLDFYRFSSDSVVKYQKLQVEEIKKYSKAPITHNLMGHFDQIDYFNLGKDLDFISWDNYPNNQWKKASYQNVAMAHDLMRGVKNKNFWVMEEQSGPCGWSVLGDTPKPGQIRLWTYQAVAHGAEAIVYFRWRACTFGAEEYWYGILDHDGIPRRRYDEVKQTGEELQKLSNLYVDSSVAADTAIVKSYDNLWSHELQPHNFKFNYNGLLISYYDSLIKNNIGADVVSIDADLSKYKVVFMPAFNLMNVNIKQKVDQYVKNGGTLVITYRSGTKTWDNAMTTSTLPGDFKEMAGIEVEEFDSLAWDRQVKVDGIGMSGTASMWCDIIKPAGAKTLAVYESEYYKGKPAATVNSYGKGKVYYIGCDLDENFMSNLILTITDKAEVKRLLDDSYEGVEAVRKVKGEEAYLMLLNHNDYAVDIGLEGSFTELITGSKIEGKVTLPPFGTAVLK